jgi:ABC-type multidrug transport system fused ATPase/permease subunit
MRQGLRRCWPFVWPYRRALLLGTGLSLLLVGIGLAQPWPMRWIVDGVLAPADGPPPDNATTLLAVAVGALVGLVVAGAVVDYVASRLLSAAGLHIANALRVAVLDRLQRLSLRYHASARGGDLVARVTSDVSYTQDMFVQVLATLLPSLLLVIGMFVVMVLLDPAFTALALLATPPLVVATHRSRVRLRLASRRVRKADGLIASAATESLSSIPLIQAFTLEDDRLRRFRRQSEDSLEAGLEAVRLESRFGPLVDVCGVLSTGVVVWFGAQRVLDGHLSLGVLLVMVTYIGSLYKPIKSLSKLAQTISKGTAAAERIAEVLDAPLDIVDRPEARSVPVRGTIELRDVSFSYGRGPVLDRLSLRVDAGEMVALVGPSGAGKTTVAALVPRLLDVDDGAVLVDGVDVRDHQLHSLRSHIAMVAQDTVLFEGTLRENLVCGRPGVRDRDVVRAARLALVDEFAANLPDGLDTRLGERGADLSGGQRQRISIARAILRDAPIVILDEPTSALDAASEELLLEALDNLPRGRTRIVIAHRLSTIRDADRIIVLEHGRISETGTHDQLCATGGLYARLTATQFAPRRSVTRLGIAPADALVPTARPAHGH